MTVEEAKAALAEAEINFEKAKGTGVSKVAAASKALSAAISLPFPLQPQLKDLIMCGAQNQVGAVDIGV